MIYAITPYGSITVRVMLDTYNGHISKVSII
jgi:hypothetical protein